MQTLQIRHVSPAPTVVGYAKGNTIVGSQGVGLAFLNVGGEATTLGNLQVSGYGDEYDGCQIYCCKLNNFGRGGTAYFWWDTPAGVDRKGNPYPAQKGWYDGNEDECYDSVPLAPGEGVWFDSPDANYKLEWAGEVVNDTTPVLLAQGSQLVSNPTPKTMALGNLKISGYGDEYDGCQIYCCKLNNFGRGGTAYFWWDTPAGVDRKGNPYPAQCGWYDGNEDECYDEIPMTPGESVWLDAPNDELTATWDNPLAED